MGDLNRLGDGQPLDTNFLNEIVDSVNNLADIVWADQGSLIWFGQTDAFNDVAKFRIVGGSGNVKFNGKSLWQQTTFTYGGMKFTKTPLVFIQVAAARGTISTVSKKDGDSCSVWFGVVDGGKPPKSGYLVTYNWIAFGPTA